MRITNPYRGFTLAELLVVQVIVVMISAVLFVIYSQSQFIFRRGSATIDMHQTARQALVRVIPLIASANSRPEDPPWADSRSVLPDGSTRTPHNLQAILEPSNPNPDLPLPPRPKLDPGPSDPPGDINLNNQIVLRSVDAYVARILRRPPLETVFNPRDPYRFQPGHSRFGQGYDLNTGIYRIFFKRDMTKTTNTEKSPGGRIGDICLDGNTPSDASDDIVLARRVYNIQFHHELRNTVDVVLCVKGILPRAGGKTVDQVNPGAVGVNQSQIDKVVRSTRVYLPIETNSPGGA